MLQTVLTIVGFLACPLMMLLMMKGMHGSHAEHSIHGAPKHKFNSEEQELADLKDRLQDMQKQYDRLAKDVKH